ncbi:MAG: hypothetical protein KME02_12785 [Aphanothece saxicola GSE-SYN-MK-01-06B]|jgi:transposase-like protein|nr:hypothetical protein [Aphanothece saxicola GSE-SYN-MK-01-06B]
MNRPRRWTPELQARAEQLQAQGARWTEIGAAIGVDESTVRYWLYPRQAESRRRAAISRAAVRRAALRHLEALPVDQLCPKAGSRQKLIRKAEMVACLPSTNRN